METSAVPIFKRTAECLAISSPEEKCCAVTDLWMAVQLGDFEFDPHTDVTPIGVAGHPEKPELVDPSKVKRRRLGSDLGRAALVHAITHIEFNAINLALDAVFRFRDMPGQFYLDWMSVAADEARHYKLLSVRLKKMGFDYGDFPAHNGLWEMAQRTADDCMKRMALVPRVLEARGLDVTPGMIERLVAAGDVLTSAARCEEAAAARSYRKSEFTSGPKACHSRPRTRFPANSGGESTHLCRWVQAIRNSQA